MSAFSDSVIHVGRQIVRRAASEQGGVISGDNPTHYTPSNPIRLFIIQATIIIITTQLLSLLFKRIRQPRVIAEVIGGILLGPTVFGRVPNFSRRIFPTESLPFLNLVATIGLILFLFLVGLEIDVRIIKRNARNSLFISSAGMILPFGMGAAIAVPIYNTFIDKEVASFGHFLLFTGVAIAITAFPVLCRILTELSLLDTDVGIVVLSSGVGNDVVGWILLALTVALVNGKSSGLTALWILLATVGYTIVLLIPGRWAFVWLARKTGSLENGQPTAFMMTVTLLVVFASAFFTDIIGVHAIFGGFLAGLIIPHEGGFAIALVEKIEDLVTLFFLPLYFTLSGLRTNLGLLNDGKSWGYIVLICVVAFLGKFLGCAATAKFCKYGWRESGAIGVLMSCKGLVELIVLNIGLQAGILDTRVFSMFVVHAIVLTFITTPLTIWVYPPEKRHHYKTEIDDKKSKKKDSESPPESGPSDKDGELKTKFSVVLSKVEHLPALMTLTQLLQPVHPTVVPLSTTTTKSSALDEKKDTPAQTIIAAPSVAIDALRLIELTARTSAVMVSSVAESLLHRDTLISVFRTFGHLNRIPVSAELSVVSQEDFPISVANHAREKDTQLVIVPWSSGTPSFEEQTQTTAAVTPASQTTYNPFDGIFGKSPIADKGSSVVYSQFIRSVFAQSPSDVALFVDRGKAPSVTAFDHHILLPFFGGPDDRLALAFVVQLCVNPTITATILKVHKSEPDLTTAPTQGTEYTEKPEVHPSTNLTVHSVSGFPDTVYGHDTTQTRLASQTADNIVWERFSSGNTPATANPLPAALQNALSRVTFEEISSPAPLHFLIERANTESKKQGKSLLIAVGRSRRMAVESHHDELRTIIREHGPSANVGGEVTRTIGDVATSFVVAGTDASLLVLQAAAGSTS